jgi:hypothetical protein
LVSGWREKKWKEEEGEGRVEEAIGRMEEGGRRKEERGRRKEAEPFLRFQVHLSAKKN